MKSLFRPAAVVSVTRQQRWCLSIALALHASALSASLWPMANAATTNTVEVFLVQGQAQIPAPTLASSSARHASPTKATRKVTVTPVAPVSTTARASASESATEPQPAPAPTVADAMIANTSTTSAGAPPVILPRFDATYLTNQAPLYPPVSRRLGEQGRVLLRVFVTPDGNARDVRVNASSGFTRLDQAARAAVERWKFVPARQGDAAVGAWVVVPVSFSLEG